MKYINLILAVLMGASCALAVQTLEKETAHNLTAPLDGFAPSLLEAFFSVSDPARGPEHVTVGSAVPLGGSVIETRYDEPYIECDVFDRDHGMYSTPRQYVKRNLDKLRTWTNKPGEVKNGECGHAICEDSSGIVWCVNDSVDHPYTVDSWNLIADGAQKILDTCTQGDSLSATVMYDDTWFVGVAECDH